MSCCGGKRAAVARPALAAVSTAPPSFAAPAAPPAPHVEFEYTGDTSMRLTGPFTRTRYQFPQPGARVWIDPRDAGFVSGVPNLRRIAKSGANGSAEAAQVR